MNEQPPTQAPTPPPTNIMPHAAPRASHLMLILVAVLGLGAVGFGLLAIVAFGQANHASSTLSSAKAAAADAARADQQAKDALSAQQVTESPFRTYTAPDEFGSFQISFPKTWSSAVDEERSSSSQVVLTLHPDFVRRSNGVDDLAGAKITLSQRVSNDVLKLYSSQKSITQSAVTVSGIKSVQLIGTFSDKRTTRMVLVPVRDKTIIFTNEDKAYAHEFDEILAQSKIIP